MTLSGTLEALLLPSQTNKQNMVGGGRTGQEGDSEDSHRAQSCSTGFGLPSTPNTCPRPGDTTLCHLAQIGLTEVIPTYFPYPLRDPALGQAPSHSQAQNTHTYPSSPTQGVHGNRNQTVRHREVLSVGGLSGILPSVRLTKLHRITLKLKGHHPQNSQSGVVGWRWGDRHRHR